MCNFLIKYLDEEFTHMSDKLKLTLMCVDFSPSIWYVMLHSVGTCFEYFSIVKPHYTIAEYLLETGMKLCSLSTLGSCTTWMQFNCPSHTYVQLFLPIALLSPIFRALWKQMLTHFFAR